MMDSLPTEILIRIFENLAYLDLKLRVALTCKKFSSILGSESRTPFGAVDKRLFRDHPCARTSERRVSKRDYNIHPALSSFDFTFSSPRGTEVYLNFRRASTKTPANVTVPWHENAVSPAVDTVVVRATYFVSREIRVKNTLEGNAVTFGDVMSQLQAAFERGMWEEPAESNAAKYANLFEYLRRSGLTQPGRVIGWQKVEAVDSPDGHVRLCVVRLNSSGS